MSRIIRGWPWAGFALLATIFAVSLSTGRAQETSTPTARRGDGVYSAVDVRTTILSIKPQGSVLNKGDVVCELEAFELRTKLAAQEKAIKSADAPYQAAKQAREVAELAMNEYLEGIYKPQIQKLENEITLAKGGVSTAEHHLATAKRLYEKKLRPKSDVETRELNLQRAKLALEKVEGKKLTLEKYTREKNIKALQGAIEKAKSEELARQAAVSQEEAARDHLKQQIENCKVVSPRAGRLSYPDGIEEGADVTKGQLLFRVVPAESDNKSEIRNSKSDTNPKSQRRKS
jgi:HlyD family secretion protein